ncbi:MAG: hypothetical protein KDI50_06310 [Candidatus Competibacteraceae bacterium]|nr:hypothetical protein [Candidatus Competibacteraceae bacterium]
MMEGVVKGGFSDVRYLVDGVYYDTKCNIYPIHISLFSTDTLIFEADFDVFDQATLV